MKVITPDMLQDLVYIDDVRVSPDGSRVAFVRVSADRSANENVRSIWMKYLRDPSSSPVRFTAGRSDNSPRWNSDGSRLGFISSRTGEPTVFVIAATGGEAQNLVGHPNGITGFEWSPDGSRIAYTASVRLDEQAKEDEDYDQLPETPDVGSTLQDSWQIKRAKDQRKHDDDLRDDPRIVDEFPYRSGTTYQNHRWTHIYIREVPVEVGFDELSKSKSQRITSGATHFSLPTWSVDGQSLTATMARRPEQSQVEYWYDLVRMASRDRVAPIEKFLANRDNHIHPVVSPDGRWIAFIRLDAEQPEFHDHCLAIVSVDGGESIDLTKSLDRSVDQFLWGKDSKHLYFTLIKDGTTNLFRVHIDSGIEQLTDGVVDVTSFDVDKEGRVVFAASTPADPSALYVRDLDGTVTQVFKPNARFLKEYTVCQIEEIHYASDGFSIQGWIITPPDFDPSHQYPLALEIHGGPSAMWSASTRSMWHEWQILAQAGYVVFYCNPRGSGGYGEQFLGANRGDWGDGPMRDVLRGVDLVVSRGTIDTERMALTGGSYGGYLAAWIVGRDQRFKAAVAQRGVYNLISMRGVTDIPFFNDRETGVTPWEDVEKLWKMSPLSLAPVIKTPMLLEHSEQDYRVPISQAEELYLALRSFNQVVELIRWPREGHELSRSGEPKHRVERIKRIVQWFDRYTKI